MTECLTHPQALKPHADFVIVTSRQLLVADMTKEWVEIHYPGIFSQILLGNHYGRTGAKRSKPDMCRDIGAVAIIDDAIEYALQCSSVVNKVLLFGDYAWNREKVTLPSNVVGSAFSLLVLY